MQNMLSLVRGCVDGYKMIEPGEVIAVGVSGGKDSLTLLAVLSEMRRFYPGGFSLHAVSLDMGFEGADFGAVRAFCDAVNVPYTVKKTDIKHVVFDVRRESNPCSLCAKMRRGSLNTAALELGAKKVALGHHFDDAVETFMMSLIYEGKVGCFRPVTYLDRTDVTQIRPMLFVREAQIKSFARRMELPVMFNPCPADKHTKREEIKQLLSTLELTYPNLRDNIFGGMQRSEIPGWKKTDR